MTLPRSCRHCGKGIGKKIKLQCGICKGLYHLICGNVSEVEARIMQEDRTPWNCSTCVRRSSSHFSQPTTLIRDKDASFMDQNRRSSSLFVPQSETLTSRDTELKVLIQELQSKVREMRKSMDFLNEKYEDELKRTKVLSEMVSEIARDNQELKKEVQKLKSAINMNETAKIKNNVCVTGLLASVKVENKDTCVLKLLHRVCPDVKESDVDKMQHIPVKNGVKTIITLKSENLKQRLLRSRATKGKITASNSGMGDSATPIYIEGELTKETYLLLKRTKQHLKDSYKYIWHRNGNILVRKADGERYLVIRNDMDLDEITA
ncbi:uncharacterized protein LOC126737769 [Anthonomus grandis grandis]|uniref:uncharacterized protein LOC126737769 n=1 Tax=Anthonomus grandis grandis TaxID=2921223 RepID=UPI002165F742|nr:uncharacterized protein LOC126737769 [Anthonomus grandis grandis]